MNHLKVLTVKNPFAFLILAGVKKYEIRSWNTKYRGQLYIHSAKKPSKDNSIHLTNGIERLKPNHLDWHFMTTHGSLLGKVELVNILRISEQVTVEEASKWGCCDIDEKDKYAWVFENPEIANLPIQIKGKLGIWNLDTEEETQTQGE